MKVSGTLFGGVAVIVAVAFSGGARRCGYGGSCQLHVRPADEMRDLVLSGSGLHQTDDGVVGNAGWAVNQGQEWVGWLSEPVVNIDFTFGRTDRNLVDQFLHSAR